MIRVMSTGSIIFWTLFAAASILVPPIFVLTAPGFLFFLIGRFFFGRDARAVLLGILGAFIGVEYLGVRVLENAPRGFSLHPQKEIFLLVKVEL